jgi:hypothetical protein
LNTIRTSGPCFICRTETSYQRNELHVRYGDEWLERKFSPQVRPRTIELLRALGEPGDGKNKVNSLLYFICEACRSELETVDWPKVREQRQSATSEMWAEHQRQAAAEVAITWRKPKPGEFEVEDHTEGMIARIADTEYRIQFRWRTSLDHPCRGASTAFRVGMWVDGVLRAHYVAWNLAGVERADNDPYERDPFAAGFQRWFCQYFQDKLLKAEPVTAFDVRERFFLPREIRIASGYFIHFTWLDGSRIAKIGRFATIEGAAGFARDHLAMDILRLGWHPVALPDSGKEEEDDEEGNDNGEEVFDDGVQF